MMAGVGRTRGLVLGWRLVLATVAALALVPAANAAAAPHVVLWSGGVAPGAAADGVELGADGSGHLLRSDSSGAVHAVGSFTPVGAKLTAIRGAASKLLTTGPADRKSTRLNSSHSQIS